MNNLDSSMESLGNSVECVSSLDKLKEQVLESSMLHLYSSEILDICEDELVFERLEIAKGDLQQQIEMRLEEMQLYKQAWREGSKLCRSHIWNSNKMFQDFINSCKLRRKELH